MSDKNAKNSYPFFIRVKNLGKKFNRDWIFRSLNLDLESGQKYAFVGRNGSGKSTLLQVLSGVVPLSEGKIRYQSTDNQDIEIDNWYKLNCIYIPSWQIKFQILINCHASSFQLAKFAYYC